MDKSIKVAVYERLRQCLYELVDESEYESLLRELSNQVHLDGIIPHKLFNGVDYGLDSTYRGRCFKLWLERNTSGIEKEFNKGRKIAREIDAFFMGETLLPFTSMGRYNDNAFASDVLGLLFRVFLLNDCLVSMYSENVQRVFFAVADYLCSLLIVDILLDKGKQSSMNLISFIIYTSNNAVLPGLRVFGEELLDQDGVVA